MSLVDEPIHNLEQAKRYFIAMGCSHFHLSRESFQRRDEYYALNISEDIEKKWRQEEVEHRLAEFPFNEPEKIGFSYSSLKDMIECDSYNLESMLTLANDFYNVLPPDQIPIVLNVIIGNNGSLTRGGLIEKACKIGRSDLAQRYIVCAKNFIGKAEDNNITILFMRGYLVDVIKALKLKEEDTYLNLLREKDNIENFKYYKQGAEAGNVFSMRMLAEHYKKGKGCDIDSAQAKYWLTQAAIMVNNSGEQRELDNISYEDTDFAFEKYALSKHNSVIKVTLGLIINPRKTLVGIKKQRSNLPGIILGVIATVSFPLMSLIGRI